MYLVAIVNKVIRFVTFLNIMKPILLGRRSAIWVYDYYR